MVADAVADGSATLVAVIVTTPAAEGAVNTALVVVVDVKLPPPVDDQVTPALVVSLVRLAVRESACDVVTPPRRGETLTVMLPPPEEDVVAEAVLEYPLRLPTASAARTR